MEDQTSNEVVKVGEWMLTYLLAVIPIVGLVMLFVWAFGGNANPSKANWAKASLLWGAIVLVLYIVIIIAFGAAFLSALGH